MVNSPCRVIPLKEKPFSRKLDYYISSMDALAMVTIFQ
jgi:hypothetical protein